MKISLILFSEIQNDVVKMELTDLSAFTREGFRNYHQDIKNITKVYCSKRFKVTNKELRSLKESYYINLAKEKLNVNFI
jgi:hypothetical protein